MARPSKLRHIFNCIKPPLQRIAVALFVLTLISVPALKVANSAPEKYTTTGVKINDTVPFVPQDHFRPWDQNFTFNILMDVHRHPSGMDPDVILEWHIASGYNAVVLTEHNTVEYSKKVQQVARTDKYKDRIKVLIGQEWTNCVMHMGMLGISEYVPVPKYPTTDQIRDVIKNVHDQGGLVVVNHIPWSIWVGLEQPSSDELIALGVDFFDITTSARLDLQTIYYARDKGVAVVAGTDAHALESANEWTILQADNFTEEAILAALHTKNTSFIFDETGYNPPMTAGYKLNWEYIFKFPWIIIGRFFHAYYDKVTGQYSFVDGYCGIGEHYVINSREIMSSALWLLFMWLLLEGGWGAIKLMISKIQQKIHPDRRRLLDDDDTPLEDLWNK